MSSTTNQYIRDILHHAEASPPIAVRFFYSSPLAIDDPLSPLPPPATASAAPSRDPPRPFSVYDNEALDKTWNELRRKILRYNEEHGEKGRPEDTLVGQRQRTDSVRVKGKATYEGDGGRQARSAGAAEGRPPGDHTLNKFGAVLGDVGHESRSDNTGGPDLGTSVKALDTATLSQDVSSMDTTGHPFIRAPTRQLPLKPSTESIGRPARPGPLPLDSYRWDSNETPINVRAPKTPVPQAREGPTAKVAVGVSRLHNVVMPDLNMEPIYWQPVNDVSSVIRGTWFYKDTMFPVETSVANMLEAGYIELQAWTETWQDELSSAVEVGASGEMKILHTLWPEIPRRQSTSDSRPSTARAEMTGTMASNLAFSESETPEMKRERDLEAACDIIDISTGSEGTDNKAAGIVSYGRYGPTRVYALSGVIYANATEAYILKPNLQPSTYYGRRPLANYIRKGHKLGVPVVRGFDEKAWNRLYPPKKGDKAAKAWEGVSSSQSGAPPISRQKTDAELAQSQRPKVTDLILVIHGIGQKLSQRMESYHFTHAMNAFRREINVELGTKEVKAHLRKDGGGIMVLPVNWRHSLTLEEGGYQSDGDDPTANRFTLKDITPDTLSSVRSVVADVMLDIPYYLSHHQPKMIAAVIHEANRVYQLWCQNNPGFAGEGRVHVIAHSLGSVMALDVLSKQPTKLPPELQDPTQIDLDSTNIPHFIFNTSNLFTAGSPAGFFILLKRAALLPRLHTQKAGKDPSANTDLVCGEAGSYGCIAVDNLYNIINPYDPVAYRMNAAVDAAYAATLKPAWIPSAIPGWFSPNSWLSSSAEGVIAATAGTTPALPRLPSTLEMETHDFSHEEIAEKRMSMLNDNGQIDYLMRYGGGPLEIQYLTMLGAHSSYWLSKDFTRTIVVECGRKPGREGALIGMRAVKRKSQLS